jgi:hypothetical protein
MPFIGFRNSESGTLEVIAFQISGIVLFGYFSEVVLQRYSRTNRLSWMGLRHLSEEFSLIMLHFFNFSCHF